MACSFEILFYLRTCVISKHPDMPAACMLFKPPFLAVFENKAAEVKIARGRQWVFLRVHSGASAPFAVGALRQAPNAAWRPKGHVRALPGGEDAGWRGLGKGAASLAGGGCRAMPVCPERPARGARTQPDQGGPGCFGFCCGCWRQPCTSERCALRVGLPSWISFWRRLFSGVPGCFLGPPSPPRASWALSEAAWPWPGTAGSLPP